MVKIWKNATLLYPSSEIKMRILKTNFSCQYDFNYYVLLLPIFYSFFLIEWFVAKENTIVIVKTSYDFYLEITQIHNLLLNETNSFLELQI